MILPCGFRTLAPQQDHHELGVRWGSCWTATQGGWRWVCCSSASAHLAWERGRGPTTCARMFSASLLPLPAFWVLAWFWAPVLWTVCLAPERRALRRPCQAAVRSPAPCYWKCVQVPSLPAPARDPAGWRGRRGEGAAGCGGLCPHWSCWYSGYYCGAL